MKVSFRPRFTSWKLPIVVGKPASASPITQKPPSRSVATAVAWLAPIRVV
jgi:hypothetical protein